MQFLLQPMPLFSENEAINSVNYEKKLLILTRNEKKELKTLYKNSNIIKNNNQP